jgi:hypothetical protein
MSTEGARLERFKLWLARHGARYPKIVWPLVSCDDEYVEIERMSFCATHKKA